jgi:hypothetical protein
MCSLQSKQDLHYLLYVCRHIWQLSSNKEIIVEKVDSSVIRPVHVRRQLDASLPSTSLILKYHFRNGKFGFRPWRDYL